MTGAFPTKSNENKGFWHWIFKHLYKDIVCLIQEEKRTDIYIEKRDKQRIEELRKLRKKELIDIILK